MSYSNNKFPDCPALMEDGKIFTDYRSARAADIGLMKQNKLNDSQSFRVFLQENATKMIINNKNELSKYVCSPRPDRKYDPLNVKNFKGIDSNSSRNYAKF